MTGSTSDTSSRSPRSDGDRAVGQRRLQGIWNGELRASRLRGRLRVQDADVDSWVEADDSTSNLVGSVDGYARALRPHDHGPGRGLRELLQAADGPGG